MDPEILDLVQRFEDSYAELAPAAEETPHRAAGGDDLFPDFPDVFDERPQAAPLRPVAAESARVVHMPRREPEAGPVASAHAPAPAAPLPSEPRLDDAADVDLDEAIEILRASEKRGSAPRANIDEDEAEPYAASADGASPSAETRAPHRADALSAPSVAASSMPPLEWAAKTRSAHTLTIVIAAAALAIGVAGGYLLALTRANTQATPIEASAQGGMQLRLDTTLPKP